MQYLSWPVTVITLTVCALVGADSWEPWPNQRVVDDHGRFYVVMKRVGGPKFSQEWGEVEFTIAERAEGTEPVKPTTTTVQSQVDNKTGGLIHNMQPNRDVSVRDGDKVLGRGTLKRPPHEVIVSSTGLGFIGLDVWGHNYGYDEEGWRIPSALVLVSQKGELVYRKRLIDLFSEEELRGFNTSAGGMSWLNYPIPDRSFSTAPSASILGFMATGGLRACT